MNYEEIIDGYNELREKCLKIARENNGKLLGDYAWFWSAIDESDITLRYTSYGVECHGYAYTCQTMSNEYFDFTITFGELEEYNARAGN